VRASGGSFFCIIQNPFHLGELKNLLEEDFLGFWGVYMKTSNLIHVVIIF